MRKSRLSKAKQDKLLEHFVAGTTARCASALVGVNFKTGSYYFQRLREIIAVQVGQEPTKSLKGKLRSMKATLGARVKGCEGGVYQDKCLYLRY